MKIIMTLFKFCFIFTAVCVGLIYIADFFSEEEVYYHEAPAYAKKPTAKISETQYSDAQLNARMEAQELSRTYKILEVTYDSLADDIELHRVIDLSGYQSVINLHKTLNTAVQKFIDKLLHCRQ